MTEVTSSFCWHQNLSPGGCMPTAPVVYTCIKSWEKMYKIRIQRDIFETCIKWVKLQGLSIDIKSLSPGGCLSLPWGYIHVLNHEKKCRKSDFKNIFFKLATNEWSDKTFLLTSKLCPLGAVCPCPCPCPCPAPAPAPFSGLYTCIKSCEVKWRFVSNALVTVKLFNVLFVNTHLM